MVIFCKFRGLPKLSIKIACGKLDENLGYFRSCFSMTRVGNIDSLFNYMLFYIVAYVGNYLERIDTLEIIINSD